MNEFADKLVVRGGYVSLKTNLLSWITGSIIFLDLVVTT